MHVYFPIASLTINFFCHKGHGYEEEKRRTRLHFVFGVVEGVVTPVLL